MRLNHDKKAALALAVLVLAFLLNWWLGPDPSDARAIERPTAALCFPLAAWDGPGALRPCYRFSRPQEDGSGFLALAVKGRIWRCRIPNPTEQPRRFSIRCKTNNRTAD